MGAADRGHEARLAQLRHQVLEVGERQQLGLGDGRERDRLGALGAVSPARRPSSTISRTPYSALVENSISTQILAGKSEKVSARGSLREDRQSARRRAR